MKTTTRNSMFITTDEYTDLYNWSERIAKVVSQKNKKHQFHLPEFLIDLMYMAASTIALFNCL